MTIRKNTIQEGGTYMEVVRSLSSRVHRTANLLSLLFLESHHRSEAEDAPLRRVAEEPPS